MATDVGIPRELDDHLFRRESGKMVAALTRIFGVHNLDLAEDVVQDAFVRALEVWRMRGIPDNPRIYGIHLWNEMWRRADRDKDRSYHPDCLYERLKRRYLCTSL